MSVPRIDTQLNKALAQKLKDLRIARGLSQMRVTMDTGVNVSRAESGKRSLSVHSVAILCRYYELSLEEFFHNIELSVGSLGVKPIIILRKRDNRDGT